MLTCTCGRTLRESLPLTILMAGTMRAPTEAHLLNLNPGGTPSLTNLTLTQS
jgi:hypothetical protein